MNTPSTITMQDAENPNLLWITEVSGGFKNERTIETIETITNTNVTEINERETLTTYTITKTVRVKKISELENTTTTP